MKVSTVELASLVAIHLYYILSQAFDWTESSSHTFSTLFPTDMVSITSCSCLQCRAGTSDLAHCCGHSTVITTISAASSFHPHIFPASIQLGIILKIPRTTSRSN